MGWNEIILADNQASHIELVLEGIAAADCHAKVTLLSDGEAVLNPFLRRHPRGTRSPCNLLFLSQSLPKLEATTLLRQLRWIHRDEPTPLPPMLVLSESEDPRTIAEAFRHGASGYLCFTNPVIPIHRAVENAVRYWLGTTLRPQKSDVLRREFSVPLNESSRYSRVACSAIASKK
jgi:DNA-binding NarL/FixJ family response regulator